MNFSDSISIVLTRPDNTLKITNDELAKGEYIYQSKGHLTRHTAYGEYVLDTALLNKYLKMTSDFKICEGELSQKNIDSAKGWLDKTINDKNPPENKPDKAKWF